MAGVADSVILTMPGTANNGGHGWITTPVVTFASYADGGYMFNGGGAVCTSEVTGEGILKTENGITSVALAPRAGAGGSGAVIVLSAVSDLADYEVSSLTFDDASSASDAGITGSVTLTMAVVQNDGTFWSVLQQNTGSLTIDSGSTVTLDLTDSVEWSDACKVVVVADNLQKALNGATTVVSIRSAVFP